MDFMRYGCDFFDDGTEHSVGFKMAFHGQGTVK